MFELADRSSEQFEAAYSGVRHHALDHRPPQPQFGRPTGAAKRAALRIVSSTSNYGRRYELLPAVVPSAWGCREGVELR